MALSNFTNIKAAVEKWLNREGFTDVTDNTEDFMIMAQRKYMRIVRIPSMEKVTSQVVSAVSFTVPADYLELKSAMIIGALPFTMVMGLMCVALAKALYRDGIREKLEDLAAAPAE